MKNGRCLDIYVSSRQIKLDRNKNKINQRQKIIWKPSFSPYSTFLSILVTTQVHDWIMICILSGETDAINLLYCLIILFKIAFVKKLDFVPRTPQIIFVFFHHFATWVPHNNTSTNNLDVRPFIREGVYYRGLLAAVLEIKSASWTKKWPSRQHRK